ncbi:hypothetical protein M422DRAFT_26108 [Sphaerobolus stellatus SS14]|nr:hypothetical protein M422DRAFT_26108 [Sphaerobolus stellatus SS14]
MDHSLERLQRYSWHQSHDQATVLLLVPYDTLPEDISVIIEQNYLVAGVRGQPPIIKGRLYANIDTTNSAWQLEPRAPPGGRGRTISSTSSHSSFALVSDRDFSSFPGTAGSSLPDTNHSEPGEPEYYYASDALHSPVLSSPPSSNDDYHEPRTTLNQRHTVRERDDFVMPQISGFSSPRVGPSLTSSFSSTESLHHASRSGRLLTLHLEKAESIIWPSLIVGPVPLSLAPAIPLPENSQDTALQPNEEKYNMDATSLSLTAVDMLDIRQERNDAFEYFIRAWHQSRIPVSTLRLVGSYVPLHTSTSQPATLADAVTVSRGTSTYYADRLGGSTGLAQLYLEAGLLHLEGTASLLMASSSTALSSIRSSDPFYHPSLRESGTETWRRDRETARKYFERAKLLDLTLDVPVLPSDGEESGSEKEKPASGPTSVSAASRASSRHAAELSEKEDTVVSMQKRRRRDKPVAEETLVESSNNSSDLWYLYLPGFVGAVIAVGVVGALSLTSWRKSQN